MSFPFPLVPRISSLLLVFFCLGSVALNAADPSQSPTPAPSPSVSPLASTSPSPSPSPGPSASPTEPPASTTAPSDKNYVVNYEMQSCYDDQFTAKKGTPVDLIFIGDSITKQWRWGSGRPVWQKYYADRAIDFGIGGDRTQNVLWRLDNLPIRQFKPKATVIMIGTNNKENSPEEIAEGVKAVISKTRECFPGVKVILMSILPNARANEKMMAANELIKPLANGKEVIYVDLASKFTPEGDNWKGLSKDKLHLTTEGYEMWAAELNPLLEKIAPKAN